MTTLLIAFLFYAPGAALSAEVSVTGNMRVQDYADIVGTMSVTGNAFSVGGTTLTASGGRVGILTANPALALDVNSSAQFGSGSMKSTFSTTGSLSMAAGASITGSSATLTATGGDAF